MAMMKRPDDNADDDADEANTVTIHLRSRIAWYWSKIRPYTDTKPVTYLEFGFGEAGVGLASYKRINKSRLIDITTFNVAEISPIKVNDIKITRYWNVVYKTIIDWIYFPY